MMAILDGIPKQEKRFRSPPRDFHFLNAVKTSRKEWIIDGG
jgi:hypothetical protein